VSKNNTTIKCIRLLLTYRVNKIALHASALLRTCIFKIKLKSYSYTVYIFLSTGRICDISYGCSVVDRLCGLVVRVPGYRSRGPGFDFRRYQIFWEVVGLERGPLSIVSIIAQLRGRNNSGSGLENREYGRGDPLRWPRDTLYPQKVGITSPTSGGRSVGIVRLRTKATKVFSISLSLGMSD
jgi:hypothetical protein